MNHKRLRNRIRPIIKGVLVSVTHGRASKALVSEITDRVMTAVRKELSASN